MVAVYPQVKKSTRVLEPSAARGRAPHSLNNRLRLTDRRGENTLRFCMEGTPDLPQCS